MGAIWPYLIALLVGLILIAAVPTLSTFFLQKPGLRAPETSAGQD